MTAPADNYSVASGAVIYGGRAAPPTGIPAWVPPSGYFADVPMTNNAIDVYPAVFTGIVGADYPFDTYGGSAILRDFSPLGAQCYYSGGHENSTGQVQVGYSYVCDFSSLTWFGRNAPTQPWTLADFNTTTGLTPDGTPYCFHTYCGLQEFPTAWGGASQGSFLAFGEGRATQMDVSIATGGYTRLVTNHAGVANPTQLGHAASGAPAGVIGVTVLDEARQGWWYGVSGTVPYTLFVHKSGAVTHIDAINGNLADGVIILCDSLNLLVSIDGGYDAGIYASLAYRKLEMWDLTTNQKVYGVTATGNVPILVEGYDGSDVNYHAPNKLGIQWVEELGAAYGLDASVSPPVIVKLTPSANPKVDPWVWSQVPVSHWSSGDPTGQAQLQGISGDVFNVFSKFRWVPSLHAFVYCSKNNRKPQVIKV